MQFLVIWRTVEGGELLVLVDLISNGFYGGSYLDVLRALNVMVLHILLHFMGHLGHYISHLHASELGQLIINIVNPVVIWVSGSQDLVCWRFWNLQKKLVVRCD